MVTTTTMPARICGWCDLELAPGSLPASHGICPRCYVRLTLEDLRRAPERARD
jgi:hypothetical protein